MTSDVTQPLNSTAPQAIGKRSQTTTISMRSIKPLFGFGTGHPDSQRTSERLAAAISAIEPDRTRRQPRHIRDFVHPQSTSISSNNIQRLDQFKQTTDSSNERTLSVPP